MTTAETNDVMEPRQAPLSGLRWPLITAITVFAGWSYYAAGANFFGWPTFWAVGLGIQGAMVYFALQAFLPIANVVAYPAMQGVLTLFGLGFLGWQGYAMGAVSLAVWLLAQRRPG